MDTLIKTEKKTPKTINKALSYLFQTRLLYLIYVCLMLHAPGVYSNWMWLGVPNSVGVLGIAQNDYQEQMCNKSPILVSPQKRVCLQHPDSLACIKDGARKGIQECQYQFKYDRWNCTTANDRQVFNKMLRKGTKETGFIYAVTSAGVVHSVTQSCSAGNLTECSCDLSRAGQITPDGWKWGGCSDNINYGVWFGKSFVDAPETMIHKRSRDVRTLMNLHNNEVGRQIVQAEMIVNCRCHGVSGSCAVKTCWRTLATFRTIGGVLKNKYDSSVVQVAPRSRRKLRRKDKSKKKLPISKDAIVYMHKSPNYCQTDLSKGITGTQGRECKKGNGPDSCNTLCCGRGYNTRVDKQVERCHCKFVYCCYVKCKTCITQRDVHTCK